MRQAANIAYGKWNARRAARNAYALSMAGAPVKIRPPPRSKINDLSSNATAEESDGGHAADH